MKRSLLIPDKFTAQLSTIEAIAIGSTAAKLLSTKGVIGEVFGVFDRTVNVLSKDRELLTLARKDVPKSPNIVLLDLPSHICMPEFGIETGANLISSGSFIQIEKRKMLISLDKATLWNPQKLIETGLATKDIIKNCDAARDIGIRYGKRGGLADLLESFDALVKDKTVDTQGFNLYARNAFSHVRMLAKAVLSKNLRGISAPVSRLIGLGPGLTPSCDDTLIGFMSSLLLVTEALGGNINYARKINHTIASLVNDQTTLLSQKLLEHAATGETVELIHNVVEATVAGTEEQVQEATFELLTVGHYSGTDALLGILLGFHVVMNMAQMKGLVTNSAKVRK